MMSEEKKLARELQESLNQTRHEIKAIHRLTFACRADAEPEAIRLRALSFPVHQLEVNVEKRKIFAPGRRPVNGEGKVKSLRCSISIKVEENKATIERAQRLFGGFVIISNY